MHVHADVDKMLISDKVFAAWLTRHSPAAAHGIPLIAEDNKQMTGTYAMLDARGRFFSNASGGHIYGPSGFDVGFDAAWATMAGGFDAAGFEERGGVYEWSPGAEEEAAAWLEAAQDAAGG